MTPYIFFIGFGVGATVTVIITLILMAIFLHRMEKRNAVNRPKEHEFNETSIELMRERNEQERSTQIQLTRIADWMEHFSRK